MISEIYFYVKLINKDNFIDDDVFNEKIRTSIGNNKLSSKDEIEKENKIKRFEDDIKMDKEYLKEVQDRINNFNKKLETEKDETRIKVLSDRMKKMKTQLKILKKS